MRKLLLIALLVVAPAAAEIVEVDGENDSASFQDNGGTGCETANCVTHVADADAATAVCDDTGGSAEVCILYDLASPSANPTTGANAQTIAGTFSQHDDANNGTDCSHVSGSGGPELRVEMFCGGTECNVEPIALTAITGDNQSVSGTFTFGTTIGDCSSCSADGSNLQINVCGTRGGGSPANRRWLGIERIYWDATVSAGGRREVQVNTLTQDDG